MSEAAGTPVRASVLIVCYRHVDLLVECLASIREHVSSAVSYEVLVLFNGTQASERERVRSALTGATVIESQVNLGFGGGNNRLAEIARGQFLVFLNDDTEVESGWLEELVETADAHPDADAVGSRILHPDRTLQEAGSVLWQNGSTIGVGRGLRAGTRRYAYLRDVDYVSACSLLVRRATFERLGGFDERYFPGYLEDVDLCLAIQRERKRVLYQPRSVVIHHESRTGADAKTFLILRGRRMLRDKWAAELDLRAKARPWDPTAVELAVHRARGNPHRLLIIDDRIPDPGGGSGFGRMLDAIRELSAAGYAITHYPTVDADGDRSTLQDLGVDVVEGHLAAHLAAPHVTYDVAIVSRPNNFRLARTVRRRQPQCPIVYDGEALFHRRIEREAALAHGAKARARLHAEARSTRKLEARIARSADRVVAVSTVEADAIRRICPGHRPIDVIEGRSLDARLTDRPFRLRRGMVLVAGWLAPYPSPNSDGLEWFLEHVMPLIKRRIPWAELRVTGRNPPEQLTRLAGPSLRFAGHVDDLGELYDSARLAVVPVRYGAGIKNKALEAVLHGVPVVATAVGAEGVPGENTEAVVVADDPAIFAEHVVALLDDRRTWEAARRALAELASARRPDVSTSWPSVVETALKERHIGRIAV